MQGASDSNTDADFTTASSVVVDRRGSWTRTVLVTPATALKPAVHGDCLLNTSNGSGSGSGSITDDPMGTTSDIPAGINVSMATSFSVTSDGTLAATIVGRAADDIVAVYVDLPDGQRITASLSNGWWSAWWPGELPHQSQPATITSQSANGAMASVSFNGG